MFQVSDNREPIGPLFFKFFPLLQTTKSKVETVDVVINLFVVVVIRTEEKGQIISIRS
jgi:hypothetical protein